MLCGPPIGCNCAFESSTLNISIGPEGQIILEQAEFTDIAALQADVAALEAWQTTAMSEISGLQTNVTTLINSTARLDLLTAGAASQAGAVGPTSGTTPLVIASTTVGPFASAGTILVWGTAAFTKTVATDDFELVSRSDGVTISRGQDLTNEASAWTASVTGLAAVAAAASPTVDITLTRTAGTGTATTTASIFNGRLVWLFIPT